MSDRPREERKKKVREKTNKIKKIWMHIHMQYMNDAMYCNEYFV